MAQTIMQQPREIWLVADSSKIGRDALVRLGHMSGIHAPFTDAPLPRNSYPSCARPARGCTPASDGRSN